MPEMAARERCELLGIPWLEKAPPSDPAAAELLAPEVAVRLGAVPLSIDGQRLLVAMIDPLDTAAVDEIATVTGRAVRRIGLDGPATALSQDTEESPDFAEQGGG